MTYDPKIHHRRSIRLKGHDYAGGGMYFVTLCAHRSAGRIFDPPAVRAMIGRVWEGVVETPVGASFMGALSKKEEGTHEGGPYVVMPDHFHALIAIEAGGKSLGEKIGAFKSLVVHEYIKGVKRGEFVRFPGKLWQRNYYERIVRSEKAWQNIAHYIRFNPVRALWRGSYEGCSFAAFGNPVLLEASKCGVLASGHGGTMLPTSLKEEVVLLSGGHSGLEQEILRRSGHAAILVAATSADKVGLHAYELEWLAQGRLLVICPFEAEVITRNNALARNRLVAQWADQLWIPCVRPGGSLDALKQEFAMKCEGTA